jgi:hypothetical protein
MKGWFYFYYRSDEHQTIDPLNIRQYFVKQLVYKGESRPWKVYFSLYLFVLK